MPNVYLTAALSGDPKVGVWNSAHFKNDEYDGLVPSTWRRSTSTPSAVAKQIQELLLDETPIIFPYFYNFLARCQAEPRSTRSRRHRPVRPLQGRLHQLRDMKQAAGASGPAA